MTKPSRVFAVQQPTHRLNGVVQPSMDLTPAEEFGEVVFLLHSAHNPFDDPEETAELVAEALTEEGYGPEDYLLMVGSPILISVVAAVAGQLFPSLRLLQWNRGRGAYVPVIVQLPVVDSGRIPA